MDKNTEFQPYFGKRCLDVSLSLLLLVIFAPVSLLVAVAILCLHGPTIVFWQKRVGINRQLFDFPKFRSMVTDAEARKEFLRDRNKHGTGEITFKMESDPRMTRTGRFIRKHSLDEIPQLWCVLNGDMSLVGPRPPTPEEVERYIGEQVLRLDIKPGLTGLWQVSGRSNLSFREQVELDLEYGRKQCLLLDVKILFLTIPAMITGRGAY